MPAPSAVPVPADLRRLARPFTVLLGLSLLAPAQLATPASAAARPDLVVSSVKVGPGTVERGDQITVRDTTANTGRARAGRSTTRFYLSKDRRFGNGDRLLGSRGVKALAPGKRVAAVTRFRVPASTPLRAWYVVACADARKKVRESREGNNCRVAPGRVTVTAPPPPPPPPVTTFPMVPDPLDVDSTLQTARAVSQFVNPHEDTEIVATAADGTTYTLTVPAGALLGPTTITMTPVASVPELPLSGGLRAGVQIEPHGLMLLEPASLEIAGPDLGPLAQQTAFLFHEDGSDFHLYPMATPQPGDDADTVRMSLTHFSTPGMGLGSLTDRNNVAAQVPGRLQSQVEGLVSEASRAAREAGEGGPPPGDWATEVVAVENAYFDQVVRPHLADAESTLSLAPKAIAEALAWSRALQLLGDTENPRHAEVMERMVRLLELLIDHHWNKCSRNSELESITELARIVRYAQLMSLPFAQEADDKLHRCANFEVRFTSSVTHSSSYSGTLQSGSTQGQWDTAARFEVPFLDFNASGALDYTDFQYSSDNTIHDDPPCTSVTVGTSTTAGRLRSTVVPIFELNPREDQEPPPVRVQVAVNVDGTQRPKEGYRRTPCNGADTVWQDTQWSSYFNMLHPSTVFTSDPARQSGTSIDTKSWSGSGSDTTGQATVELWHKPLL